ncbi:DVU_1555 family C-GCAxxG-C-C protein [Clostridiisalibacter paucivorans]|uniref:DVU_1555 family C-GCAxxG-C-C protein n=1 Tax=Clostridiisalibacter paucivorans TaxID=408753 RepID=UPI00047A6AFC|nr:DV_1555 family C-GCAxxG-C-C protein [Clostridiisalibacter paucivorans]
MDEIAFRIFQLASQGYCCTQIMVKILLEQEGKENTDLIKAINGLCGGIGFSKGVCGVLTGGVCILGLYSGKGKDDEYRREDFGEMINEYMEWFEEEFGSKDCVDIAGDELKVGKLGETSYPVKCGGIIEKGLTKVWEIMDEHNYELGER